MTNLALVLCLVLSSPNSDKAERLMVSGKGEEARALLAEEARKNPDPKLIILMARSHMCFPPAAPDEAVKVLKPFLTANPQHVEGLLEWARALRELRDYPNANKTYDRILKGNPKEFRAHHGKVDTALVQKKYKEAESAARAALAGDATRPECHYYLGRVFERRDDDPYAKARAVTAYRKAVELAGADTRYVAPLLFAQAIYRTGGYTETLAKLKGMAPGDASVAFGEGLLLDQEGRLKEAFARYQGAVDVDWGHTFAHFALGTIYSGRSMTTLFSGRKRYGRRPASSAGVLSPARASSEYAIVRFQDPSFPLLGLIDRYQSGLQGADEGPSSAELEAQQKAWNEYWLLLQQRH